jgi:hypothetical protein
MYAVCTIMVYYGFVQVFYYCIIKGLRGRLTDVIKLKGDMIYSSFLQTGTVQGQGHYLVKHDII